MLIYNVNVFTEEEKFVPGAVLLRDDRIEQVFTGEKLPGEIRAMRETRADDEEEWIDGKGGYCFPGMIDLHFHGCKGYDFCDGTREAVEEIARYEASIGVTAIAPATMTLPVEELVRILHNGASFKREQEEKKSGAKGKTNAGVRAAKRMEEEPLADLLGVNMEGPFISPVKCGAQDPQYILSCDADICRRFLEAGEGLVKFIGLAPEEVSKEQAERFIREIRREVSVYLAHTNADYDSAKAAFDAGADHLVHMYNAMPPFSHRAPGVIGAAADSSHVMAEIICDGVHIHPSAVRAAFAMMGAERMILISDSMRAAGMPDGIYTLGGQDVQVRGNHATLVSDGSLAGSVTPLPDCVRTAVRAMGIPLETAIACATIHPARSLGVETEYGSIAPGKRADLVLWDQKLELVGVIKDGKIWHHRNS